MAELTAWTKGVLVDDEAAPPRPRGFIGGLALLLLVVDALLAVVLGGSPAGDPPVEDARGVRAVLQAAAADPGEPWLLVGDSVLAGDVMRGKVDDWEHHRVIDEMRASVNPESRASFHQVALDAMLPVDMRAVLAELDAVDPGARVPVVIELNPRYFSPSYAELGECTRPWLCELGPRLLTAPPRSQLRWPTIIGYYLELAGDALVDVLPVARHHRRIARDPLATVLPALTTPAVGPEPDPLSARARVLAHYRDLALGSDSKQIQALRAMVERLRASGRTAVFFTTPLEDEFLGQAMSPVMYGHYSAMLSRIIEGRGEGRVSLVQLDHPLFASPLFLDHCHLGAEGNRRLAVNLLAELGIGLAEVPRPDELAHRDGPDRTLVSRIEQGFADGAAWHAEFVDPVGVAVTADGGRVVVADTGNHVLRQLAGRMQTVRVLAGIAGKAGARDGPAHRALLNAPSHPVLVGHRVYFADQKGTAVRVLDGKDVGTITVASGPSWTRIDGLVAHGAELLVLDDASRVLRLDPATGETREIVTTSGDVSLTALTTAPDGALFVVDGASRIWRGHVDVPMTVGDPADEAELVFANTATEAIPQGQKVFFPFRFEDLRLVEVVGIQWVERYRALLVQDDHRPNKPGKSMLTERIHLRLLDVEAGLIYPWLKPMTAGAGYMTYNKKSDSFVTPIHVGSMAMAQDSATLFYLERERSRLFMMSDGILGAAKAGFITLSAQGVKYLLGQVASTETLERLHPDHHLGARLEFHERAGPYLGVVFGSSMISSSDMIGTYAYGMRLEEALRDALGYRDGIRFDLIERAYKGVRSEVLLKELRTFVETGAQPDVIFIETAGTRTRQRFFQNDASEERMRAVLAEIDAIARIHDSLVVFFDNSALVSAGREGLRAVSDDERRFHALARAAGFTVISVGDELLRDALEVGPVGSPPYAMHHASPWGIDASARIVAARSYPLVQRWLRGRVPAWMRPPFEGVADPEALADAFAAVGDDWPNVVTAIAPDLIQSDLTGDRLEVFVDVGRLELGDDPEALEATAIAALWAALVQDPVGTRARHVGLRLARFRRYDEYGAGVRDAAEVVLAWDLDRAALVAKLTEYRARR